MDLADREANPYAPPQEAGPAPEATRLCSYCGEPATAERKLVESPDGRSLICRSCAVIVIDAIDGRRDRSFWRIASVTMWIAFVALLLGAWAFNEWFETVLPSIYGIVFAALAVSLLLLHHFSAWMVRRNERFRYR